MRKTRFLLVTLWLLLLIFPSFSDFSTAISSQDYWPTEEWRTHTPEDQGLNSSNFDEMESYVESAGWSSNIDSLLVVRNGYIVYEKYRAEYLRTLPHHIYSCTKVVTSTLIGICMDEGNITSIHNPVIDYFPDRTFQNMNSQKESITIQHLLSMTAGLDWYDNTDYYSMEVSPDPVQYVLDKPMVANPGQEWEYNTGCSHLLSNIIENVSVAGTAVLAEQSLFQPLGIDNYLWNTMDDVPNGGTLLYLKSRDMAKIGLLYLNNGTWDDAQIVSEAWVDEATSQFISLQNYWYPGYGYKWWLYNSDNGFGARGTNTQNIMVFPELDIIVVSTGGGDFPFEHIVHEYILTALLPPNSSFPWWWVIGGVSAAVAVGLSIGVYFLVKKKRD